MSEGISPCPPGSAAYYLDRIQRLSHVVDDASADRDLAVLRAHERGASHQEIARRAHLKPAEVEAVVTALLAEEDIADWCDGPDYLPAYSRYH
ncbi:hypothetical protein N0X72_04925 [Streptomyces carpaticus]|uniref:Uncharacterized protein n=2 Tax=Streptomyces TaxID=1883 RepID=A0A1I6QG94_9ACTN|nr:MULTISPECIES: hypothetical protein [Streptomyces]UWM48415.1 hypothetical protein N0X72_04925 [Streptomyces carpaticus]SFS51509.1 hypothetical protein SAMN05444716_10217 [Streptomyces harbinensis]